MSNKFSWVPFYEELANILLKYKGDRGQLIVLVKDAHNIAGRPLPKIETDNKNISDIDPFTVFALFNRGKQSAETRKSLCKGFKQVFGMKCYVPNDFDGIPVYAYSQYCFYRFIGDNKRSDKSFEILWNIFEQAIIYADKNYSEDFKNLFTECLTLPLVGLGKLTMGLFLIRPTVFLNLDKTNINYLERYKEVPAIHDGAKYLELCSQIISELPNYKCGKLYELSFKAFEFSVNSNAKNDNDDRDTDNKTFVASNKNIKYMQNSQSKNVILYGPPGTGKTYNTVRRAVEIIDGEDRWQDKNYCEIKARYDELLKGKRIAFVTFHQSYGYEEFIEGIKPETTDEGVTYEVKAGAFKEFCNDARVSAKEKDDHGINSSPTIWKVSLEGTYDNPTRRDCLENGYIRVGYDSYGKDVSSDADFSKVGGKNVLNAFINGMRIGDLVLSCYTNTTIDAIGVITGDYEWHSEFDKYKRLRRVRWIYKGKKDIYDINGGNTFSNPTVHRLNNMSLSDVLDIVNGNDNLVKNTATTSNNSEKSKYVFIIDEINRGNISKTFGELITLIEDNKREGAKEATSVKLPYSKTNFLVPDNVYIIGTMNTADRSIAAIDTALRRRFKFEEMMPKSDVIKCKNIDGIDIPQMLDRINERIEVLYDREHTIGHAYFMSLEESAKIKELSDIFRNKIIPLLQEYFYEDYEKICLVLGDNQKKEEYRFIKSEDINYTGLFGSSTDICFGEKSKKYSINEEVFLNKNAYIGIYAPTNE